MPELKRFWWGEYHNRCIRLLRSAFARPKSAKLLKRSKKAYFTIGRDLWPKAREQNSATESGRQPSSLGKFHGYRK